jgi:hypothetical protein
MYDLTINIDSEQNGLTYIQPGIHENIQLGRPDGSYPIVYEKSKNNNEFLAFHFMNNEKQTFVHTEWIPKADDPAILEKKNSNLVKRILHIAKKIVDENLLKFKVETFEQLSNKIISVIGDNYKGKLFRCKIIYNNKNYTTFPNYVPFIENMEVPLEQSNLRISGDDKVIKSRADAPIISNTNPFMVNSPTNADEPNSTNSSSSTTMDDTLPF